MLPPRLALWVLAIFCLVRCHSVRLGEAGATSDIAAEAEVAQYVDNALQQSYTPATQSVCPCFRLGCLSGRHRLALRIAWLHQRTRDMLVASLLMAEAASKSLVRWCACDLAESGSDRLVTSSPRAPFHTDAANDECKGEHCCPVCGMVVTREGPRAVLNKGQELLACSDEHLNDIVTQPRSFLEPTRRVHAPHEVVGDT